MNTRHIPQSLSKLSYISIVVALYECVMIMVGQEYLKDAVGILEYYVFAFTVITSIIFTITKAHFVSDLGYIESHIPGGIDEEILVRDIRFFSFVTVSLLIVSLLVFCGLLIELLFHTYLAIWGLL